MAHTVQANAEGCPTDNPWGVMDADGNKVSCHSTEAEAEAAATAADEAPAAGDAGNAEVPFSAVLAVEGVETGDGLMLEVGGASWRNPPLPLMIQVENAGGGHMGAVLGGRIDSIQVEDRRITARGFLVPGASDEATAAVDLVRSQTLRFVSIDVGQADVEYEVRSVDEEGWPVDVLARFRTYEIMGATVTPFPALADAVIWLDGEQAPMETATTLPEPPEPVEEPEVVDGEGGPMLLLASAADLPPLSWFERSDLHDEYAREAEERGFAPMVRERDGRVWGYLAWWGVCHTRFQGQCLTPPSSEAQYAYFTTGTRAASCGPDCGDHEVHEVATGVLTVGTGHADESWDVARTVAHYDNTGTAVADIAIGEDSLGIFFAGAVRSGATREQIETLCAGALSGDWRRLGGSLELVAALSVNVPGFPLVAPRAHLAAAGYRDENGVVPMIQTSLVGTVVPGSPERQSLAASASRVAPGVVVVPRREWEAQQDRMHRLEQDLADLRPLIAQQIAQRLER